MARLLLFRNFTPFKERTMKNILKDLKRRDHKRYLGGLDVFKYIGPGLHRTDKPLCIIANTIKGKGLEYLYNKPLMHGYMPKEKDDIELAFRELKSY